MCRIAGLINHTLPANQKEQMVKRMCDVLINGGPDDGGIYVSSSEEVVFGNRRLALLDLSPAGHQPMHYRNRYHITYNGELYNHLSLKAELIALGHQFANHTDTEVILAAFAEWQHLSFAKLEGMFAFCLYDEVTQKIFLVRDPSGIKPLYYSTSFDSLLFASEVRAMKVLPLDWETDEHWKVLFMAYGHIPEPYTTCNNIRSLHKGFFMQYSLDSRQYSIQSYLQYSIQPGPITDAPPSATLRKLIDNAVASHMLADAPVGVFLSGGIDSSIIALSAAAQNNKPINCLSVDFSEQEFSESKYQDIMVQTINGNASKLLLNQDEFTASLQDVVEDMDLPSCDGINTWFICRMAKKAGLKAVQSGLGADELFGGYPSFQRMSLTRKLQQLPSWIKTAATTFPSKKFSRAEYLNLEGMNGRYLFLRGQFPLHEIAQYLDADKKEVLSILQQHPPSFQPNISDPRNEASWMEYHLYMQNQLLRDADVMSMAHGVEIRVPFLDHQLVQWAMRLAPENKFYGANPKQILIDAFSDALPEAIWNRKKMGFSFPFSQWLRNNEWVKETVQSGPAKLSQYHSKFVQGNLHWYQMMSMLIMHNKLK